MPDLALLIEGRHRSRARGLVRRAGDSIKILGDGELKTKLTVQAHAFSESAKQKIAAAGGSVEIVSQAGA